MHKRRGRFRAIVIAVAGLISLCGTPPVQSQPEQLVEVVIRGFTFVTKQKALRLGLPTTIMVIIVEPERIYFGSTFF